MKALRSPISLIEVVKLQFGDLSIVVLISHFHKFSRISPNIFICGFDLLALGYFTHHLLNLTCFEKVVAVWVKLIENLVDVVADIGLVEVAFLDETGIRISGRVGQIGTTDCFALVILCGEASSHS